MNWESPLTPTNAFPSKSGLSILQDCFAQYTSLHIVEQCVLFSGFSKRFRNCWLYFPSFSITVLYNSHSIPHIVLSLSCDDLISTAKLTSKRRIHNPYGVFWIEQPLKCHWFNICFASFNKLPNLWCTHMPDFQTLWYSGMLRLKNQVPLATFFEFCGSKTFLFFGENVLN